MPGGQGAGFSPGFVSPAGGQSAPPQSMLWGSAPVTVGDADVADVTLALQEGFNIAGRFEFTGTRPRPDPQRLAQVPVVVEPADGSDSRQQSPPARATAEGRFVTASKIPGKYFLRVGGPPPGFIVQSISVNGVDATDAPFDLTSSISNAVITFTDQVATVSGTVTGLSPGADPPAVVLFPADSTVWKNFGYNPLRMRTTRVSPTGVFSFGSLISGDYFAAAIRDEFSSEWQDPAYLTLLSRSAQRFTLGAGEKKVLTLEVSNVKPPGIGRGPMPVPAAREENPADLSAEHGPFVHGPVLEEQTPQAPVRDTRAVDPTGTGSISGTVMQDDGSPRPARMARVEVRGPGLFGSRTALTGDDGRYTVGSLPPGEYQVLVTKPAYLNMYYGGKRPTLGPGTTVTIKAGQSVGNIDVTLAKGAVIAGTVVDPLGQPAPGVRVQLLMFGRREGERMLTSAGSPMNGGMTSTDDRGEYPAVRFAAGHVRDHGHAAVHVTRFQSGHAATLRRGNARGHRGGGARAHTALGVRDRSHHRAGADERDSRRRAGWPARRVLSHLFSGHAARTGRR